MSLIYAEQEIQSSWLHPKVIEYLLQTSVAVNNLYQPFDEKEFVHVIAQHQSEPIRQIGFAYEAPWFSRAWEYFTPSWLDLNNGSDSVDISSPGVYWISRHPDGSIGLLMFVRWKVIQLTWPDKWVDRRNIYLNGIFQQYRRLVQHLTNNDRPDPQMLAMVGILPGVAIKRANKFPEFADIIDMCRQKNHNSWRFIHAAIRRILQKQWIQEDQLVILGSWWTLWRAVATYFPQARLIDIDNKSHIPNNGKWIIVDCTTGGSLTEYIDALWKDGDWTWISESYPPPPKDLAIKAIQRWIWSYHIKGVSWEIIPPFPLGYDSTPPCCIWLLDQDADSVVVMKWPEEA